ncbi:evasin P467-like [Dermacentor variabilis]|uniref:evasin P467-like n=1 Tax=Dermacentor variabilis TaxID=34621 RepID=UPI003F5B6930
MNAFVYAAVISLAVWVACEPYVANSSAEPQLGNSSPEPHHDNSSEGDYYYEPVGCPFTVAVNASGFGMPVNCSQECNNGTETIPDGTPCYAIGRNFTAMALNTSYVCPLGECQNGTCVANGLNNTCYRMYEEE